VAAIHPPFPPARPLLGGLLALGLAGCTWAAPAERAAPSKIELITRMAPAIDRALEFADRHGPDRVLVVFDVDSTLLFDPQGGPDLDELESTDPRRFRDVERTVMNLKSLTPTEPQLLAELARLDAAGIARFAMTARGADMRDMTHRELEFNGITFARAPECGPPLCTRRGRIAADQVLSAARSVLGSPELARLEFDRGRRISVSEGVLMATGLDKGVLTRVLLASLGGDYRAVVFVDDAQKNVTHMSRASQAMSEDVAIFHYRAPLPAPSRSSVDRNAAWQAAESAICAALAPRWCVSPP
jgi:hypothetical protein